MAMWGQMCGLSIACLWPGFGQSWGWIWDCSMPECGMFVWPVMAVYVNCFVGVSNATIGLENQVIFACF